MESCYVWLLVLAIANRIAGQTIKQQVETNLEPFEHFVGTARENERATLWQRMNHWDIPGVSIAVIKDFRVDWAEGYGKAQLDVNATRNTIYQAGTLSSLFTALATLKLVQNNTLNLESSANSYLTSWKIKDGATEKDNVLLKHLLSHTGGLTVEEFDGYEHGATLPTSLLQTLNGEAPANNLKVETDESLLGDKIEPGTEESYSSGGYAALQQLLEDVTGMPYKQIVQELVIDKADLTLESSFDIRNPSNIDGIAFGTFCNTTFSTIVPGNWRNYPESGAQGLWTNVNDLAKLAINIGLGHNNTRSSILDDTTTNKMMTIVLEKYDLILDSVNGTFGLGTEVVAGTRGHKWFVNTGNSEGYCSEIIGSTDGRGLVMMANHECDRAHFLFGELFRSVATSYDWADAVSLPISFNTRLPAKYPLTSPQDWEGNYKVDPIDLPLGFGQIELPFEHIYITADNFQPDSMVCSVRFYPCANKENVYCPVMSIFQDVTDKLGEITFQRSGDSYTGTFFVADVILEDITITFERIARVTTTGGPPGTGPTTTSTASPASSTKSPGNAAPRAAGYSPMLPLLTFFCMLYQFYHGLIYDP